MRGLGGSWRVRLRMGSKLLGGLGEDWEVGVYSVYYVACYWDEILHLEGVLDTDRVRQYSI